MSKGLLGTMTIPVERQAQRFLLAVHREAETLRAMGHSELTIDRMVSLSLAWGSVELTPRSAELEARIRRHAAEAKGL